MRSFHLVALLGLFAVACAPDSEDAATSDTSDLSVGLTLEDTGRYDPPVPSGKAGELSTLDLSPDGKWVVFEHGQPGTRETRFRNLVTGETRDIADAHLVKKGAPGIILEQGSDDDAATRLVGFDGRVQTSMKGHYRKGVVIADDGRLVAVPEQPPVGAPLRMIDSEHGEMNTADGAAVSPYAKPVLFAGNTRIAWATGNKMYSTSVAPNAPVSAVDLKMDGAPFAGAIVEGSGWGNTVLVEQNPGYLASVDVTTGEGRWITREPAPDCGKSHIEHGSMVYTLSESWGSSTDPTKTFTVTSYDRANPATPPKTIRTKSRVQTGTSGWSCTLKSLPAISEDGQFLIYMSPNAEFMSFTPTATRVDGTGEEIVLDAQSINQDTYGKELALQGSTVAYLRRGGGVFDVKNLATGDAWAVPMPVDSYVHALGLSRDGKAIAFATLKRATGGTSYLDLTVADREGLVTQRLGTPNNQTSYATIQSAYDGSFLFMTDLLVVDGPSGKGNPLYRIRH